MTGARGGDKLDHGAPRDAGAGGVKTVGAFVSKMAGPDR